MNANSSTTLQLRLCAVRQREAVAWYLPGGEPEAWLEQFGRWAEKQDALRFHRVAGGDGKVAGLLVIPEGRLEVPAGWRGLPMGSIREKFYLPVDAELFPPVTALEVDALCRADITFFHPGLGISEYAESEALGVWDLLRPPPVLPADWNAARSEPGLSSRLKAVVLLALPGEDELFGDAPKDIGSEPPKDLPRRRNEPSAGAMGTAGRAMGKMFAGAVQKVMSWMPAGGSKRTWVNDVMDWAASKLLKVSEEMEELRNKELHRLLDLLNNDPEQGLRHALPLGGDPGRGRSAPGAQLWNRDLSFHTGSSGSGPMDPWDVPMEIRRKLTERYRQLAQRERELGRYRRAAYIYAQLLNDWSLAAAVLREGRHFAEAAVVYRDRLQSWVAAAECFEAGGLFSEAVAIYEQQHMYVEQGDLLRRLEDEEAACIAYRKAVEVKVNAGDWVSAAKLLEERVRAPDEALALLGKFWPHSMQAAQCLKAEFELLARLGRHEAARQRVDQLRAEVTPPGKTIPLAEILSGVHKTYPDASLRPLAADVALVKIGGRLAIGDADEIRAGVRILSELAPEDRLLARDTSRFLAAQLERLRRQVPPPPPVTKLKSGPKKAGMEAPIPVRTFQLPKVARVWSAKRCGRSFVAGVNYGHNILAVVRGDWEGEVQAQAWNYPVECKQIDLRLDEAATQPDQVFVKATPLGGARQEIMPSTDGFRGSLFLEWPAWMPSDLLDLAVSGSHQWILRVSAGEVIIDVRGSRGEAIGGFPLTACLEGIDEPIEKFCMLAIRSQLWLAFGRHLFVMDHSGKAFRHWVCETTILGLEASSPLLAAGVVVRCERGVAIFWTTNLDAPVTILGEEIEAPLAVFLGNGSLVLVSTKADGAHAGLVLDVTRQGCHGWADFSWKGEPPVSAVATDERDGFAIFTASGGVHLFRVPGTAHR